MKVKLNMGLRGMEERRGVMIYLIDPETTNEVMQLEIDSKSLGLLLCQSGQPMGNIRYINKDAIK